MTERTVTEALIRGYIQRLREDEKSPATVAKYRRDLRHFAAFTEGRPVTKSLTLEYKAALGRRYAPASANSMLAALNGALRFAGWHDCCIRQFRIQKEVFCPEEKELSRTEYQALVRTAGRKRNERLSLLLQTICSTGIRVSELEYITAEAARKGEAVVTCKGKTRRIFLIPALRKKLLRYAEKHGVTSGAIFVTKSGRTMDRSNIWAAMKKLCGEAGVSPEKVFPHNLRHLFARIFYGLEKDIAKLADLLGHSSINTTRIYILSTGAEHRRKMEHMHLIL